MINAGKENKNHMTIKEKIIGDVAVLTIKGNLMGGVGKLFG